MTIHEQLCIHDRYKWSDYYDDSINVTVEGLLRSELIWQLYNARQLYIDYEIFGDQLKEDMKG